MRAELVEQTEPAIGVPEGDELLGEELHSHRRTVRFRQLIRKQRGNPVAPEVVAEERSRSGTRQLFVLVPAHRGYFT